MEGSVFDVLVLLGTCYKKTTLVDVSVDDR